MSEIKEVNTLGTIASIRKATQDSLKPIIEEIERKMTLLSKETAEIAEKTSRIFQLEKKQSRSDETIRYLQSQVLQTRQQIQSIQLQQLASKEEVLRSEERIAEENRKIRKQKEKQDTIIKNINDKNEKVTRELKVALESIKRRQQSMEDKFKKLSDRTEVLNYQVTTNNDKMQKQFAEMQQTLNRDLKNSSRRLQLLDMYEAEKEIIFNRMQQMSQGLSKVVLLQEYQLNKECVKMELLRVVQATRKMIDDNLSEKTRQLLILLPQMREQILHCLGFQEKFKQVNKKSEAMLTLIQSNRTQVMSNHDNFKSSIYDKFLAVEQEKIVMENDIQKALGFEAQMNQKLDIYSERLKQQLRQQNEKKSRQLYQQIKVSFADKKQEIRERELSKIIEQRQKLFDRSMQMQNLANRIGQVLTNFSTKITKLKSDNEIFVKQVKKELLQLDIIRRTINSNDSLIGQTLAQIIQAILINNCIQIEQQSKIDEDISFSTIKDGVIFQKNTNHKPGHERKILYRRKIMNSKVLKRSLVASMIGVYDKLMVEDNCLKWHEQSPSHFFKLHIEPIYMNLLQKMDKIQQQSSLILPRNLNKNDEISTIHARQTILSSFENESTFRKFSTTHRSRKARYDDNSIFLPKSARRGRASINTTIALQ